MDQPDSPQPRIIAEVGGSIDEVSVSVCIHGEDLDPDAITARLGCEPSASHRRGDRRPSRRKDAPPNPPATQGAWFLSARGAPPETVETLTAALLDRLPADERVWAELAARYDVQLRYGIHIGGFNQGFDLSPSLVRRIAGLHASVGFDIYADGDEET